MTECRGAAGHNIEYVIRLADFFRDHLPEVHDDHLFSLEASVRQHMEQKKMVWIESSTSLKEPQSTELAATDAESVAADAQVRRDSFQHQSRLAPKKLLCLKVWPRRCWSLLYSFLFFPKSMSFECIWVDFIVSIQCEWTRNPVTGLFIVLLLLGFVFLFCLVCTNSLPWTRFLCCCCCCKKKKKKRYKDILYRYICTVCVYMYSAVGSNLQHYWFFEKYWLGCGYDNDKHWCSVDGWIESYLYLLTTNGS